MTDAEWNKMVEQQRAMLQGEEIVAVEEQKEEVKKNETISLLQVAKVNWDYFSEENVTKISVQNVVPNADKARQLRDAILKTHKEFDQIKESTNAVMSKSSLSDPQVAAQARTQQYNSTTATEARDEAKIVDVNGQICLQHQVDSQDSLMRLSLKYNVSDRDIKNINGLFSEQIHHLQHINIPMNESFKMQPQSDQATAGDAMHQEMSHRTHTISQMQ